MDDEHGHPIFGTIEQGVKDVEFFPSASPSPFDGDASACDSARLGAEAGA
jgi:hypothetical protein